MSSYKLKRKSLNKRKSRNKRESLNKRKSRRKGRISRKLGGYQFGPSISTKNRHRKKSRSKK